MLSEFPWRVVRTWCVDVVIKIHIWKALKWSVSDVQHRWLRSCERCVFVRVRSRWQSPQVPFLLYCTLSAVPRAIINDWFISPSRFQLSSPAQRAAAEEKSLLLYCQRFRNEHICAFKFCSVPVNRSSCPHMKEFCGMKRRFIRLELVDWARGFWSRK